ncbi:MAG: sigma-70 family RNA polymerase sigma factor [Polyangiaceae bacterium]|nr:sigma-70 family RNA polymerase sigma factor [Polyangiaceae bacterium]
MRRRSIERHATVLVADLGGFSVEEGLWSQRVPAHRRADDVRDAVARALTDKQREVVEAYFFEGLSQGDIARRLGITQQVVHKRIFGAQRDGKTVGGALARLRAALGGAP